VTRKILAGTALAVLTVGTVLAGCSNDSGGHDMNTMPASTTAAPAGQPGAHNQADIAFAQGMIPHHAQAVDMATLVAGHTTNPKVADLAGRIQKAQAPEIQQMTGWLTTWGAAPAVGMPSGHSMPGMSSAGPMPTPGTGAPMGGMMSADDMSRLRAALGADFDRMWLQMMTQHHQGAIDMSTTELNQGSNAEAKALAQKIIDGQRAEITEMKGLLGQG
jgi:uncharacterized protein (DUF305 family)